MRRMVERYVSLFGENVKRFRETMGFSQEQLAEKADLDRSYIGGIERGERNPSLKAIIRLALALNIAPHQLFQEPGAITLPVQHLAAHQTDNGITLAFKYDQYDATYDLNNATVLEFQSVIKALRVGLLSKSQQSQVVANTFLRAIRTWPQANPSDLWTFLMNRAYCDRNNHPSESNRLNLEQSWKRTSGWALEYILTQHYETFLQGKGVTLILKDVQHKKRLLDPIGDSRIIPAKADIVVTYRTQENEKLLGVIHVKASSAERRTDDIPMSQALIQSGFLSVLWTMDVKSMPSSRPVNHGEFGQAANRQTISDKRKDIEEHGHFSACFSYNANTVPTPENYQTPSRIFTCNFQNPNDAFTAFLSHTVQVRSGHAT